MFIILANLLVAVHGNGQFYLKYDYHRGGTRSRSSSYRDTLEETILGLNQQLRVLQEEKRHFKMKLKKQRRRQQQQHQSEQGRKRKVNTARIPPIEEEEDSVESTTTSLEETLSKLELECKQSLQSKHDLERLYNEYTKKMKSLEQRCKSSTIQYQTIQEECVNQILRLELEIMQFTVSQNTTLTEVDSEWLQQRIKEVQQQAILDFWNTIGNTKLTEVEHDMQEQHCLLLDKERQKSVATIQRLRHRQRSLAKTMAVREYQLHQHLQQIENEKKRKQQQEEEDLLILTAEQEEEERMKRIQQAKDDAEKERQRQQQRPEEEQEEEKRKKETEQSPSATSSSSFLTRIVPTNFLFKSSKGPPPSPTTTKRYVPSIENWNQRRVPWQPISIPPNDVLRRTLSPTTTTTM
jgi:hypothetical protein